MGMDKEFIPYKQALQLKELGFGAPYCIGSTNGGSVFYYENGKLYYDGHPMYSSSAHSGQIDAPLYQQAFRWFREKHKLHSEIIIAGEDSYYGEKNGKYFYSISKTNTGELIEDTWSTQNLFNTNEKAELACLKKLIKLTQKTNKTP